MGFYWSCICYFYFPFLKDSSGQLMLREVVETQNLPSSHLELRIQNLDWLCELVLISNIRNKKSKKFLIKIKKKKSKKNKNMSWAVLSTADALEDFLTYQNNNISINSNYFEECFFFFWEGETILLQAV